MSDTIDQVEFEKEEILPGLKCLAKEAIDGDDEA